MCLCVAFFIIWKQFDLKCIKPLRIIIVRIKNKNKAKYFKLLTILYDLLTVQVHSSRI